MRHLALLIALVLGFAPPALAADPPGVTWTGSWRLTLNTPDGTTTAPLELKADGDGLAGTSGAGIGVSFTSETRHHVRSGTATDGGRLLVVNKYCCPPRDISSNVVPEQYFTLTRGQSSEGHFVIGTIAAR